MVNNIIKGTVASNRLNSKTTHLTIFLDTVSWLNPGIVERWFDCSPGGADVFATCDAAPCPLV
jgi:hypothetical protein